MQTNLDTIVREVIFPERMDTHFFKRIENLEALFNKDTSKQGGASITIPIQTSVSTNAATYDKSDVHPVADDAVWVDATWTKKYQHVVAEVHNIDISQAADGGQPSINNLARKAIDEALSSLFDSIFDDIWTQVKLDIDETGTYSDAALNRTTYPTLASDEDNVNTGITLNLVRSQVNAARLNKDSGPKSGFMHVMETAVYERFEPLVAMLHSWNLNDPSANIKYAGGYQQVGSFEQVPVVSPKGLTTGDCFFIKPKDLYIKYHRDLTIKSIESDRDSQKWVMNVGVNGFYVRPGFAGKQTLKD
jgi:hypothetical protein